MAQVTAVALLVLVAFFVPYHLCAEEHADGMIGEPSIQARFSFQQSCVAYPKYSFIDTSRGQHDTCTWYFGDGNTSGKCFDSHTFYAPGKYDVKLVISGPLGTSTATQQVEVTDLATPIEVEILVHQVPSRPYEVVFSYKPTGDFKGTIESCNWDFGDSYIDDSQSPIHSYESTGEYNVVLTVTSCERVETFHTLVKITEPVPLYLQLPQAETDVLDALEVDKEAIRKTQLGADHPCLVPGAVLDALERNSMATKYIYHRYDDERGAYRLIPYMYSKDFRPIKYSDTLESTNDTVFYVLASIPWGKMRSWFIQEMHLMEKDNLCQVVLYKKYGFTPSEDLSIYQASQVLHSAWRSYMQKILSLRNADNTVTAQDVLAWPDPLMYTRKYIKMLPQVEDFTRIRQGDIALDGEDRIVFAPFSAEYFEKKEIALDGERQILFPTSSTKHHERNEKEFFGYRITDQGLKVVDKKDCLSLKWYRPVAEFWDGRPTDFVTVGGHDCDGDGIHSGMDSCPYCAEDYIGQCESDGCPSKIKVTDVRPHYQAGFLTILGYWVQSGFIVTGFGMAHPTLSFEINGAVGVDDGPRLCYGGEFLLKLSKLSFLDNRIEPIIGAFAMIGNQRTGEGGQDWRLYAGLNGGLEGLIYTWYNIELKAVVSGYFGIERREGPPFLDSKGIERRTLFNYPDGGVMLGIKTYIF